MMIAAGEYYAMAITNNGLYGWGMNVGASLGIGTKIERTALPLRVTFPKQVTMITKIAASTNHSLALTNDGVYAWGLNSVGQSGLPANVFAQVTPAKVKGEDNAVAVAAAEYSSLALH